ncbi:MAG: hypothetical protein CMF31_07900 [Kordiimonas sp.]|nr:hypothetical protein [Kordiimonas sp.]|tara:strand:- start:3329 stop:3811 length:483 start_codon:yes stop_codon:yes gene_type:complete
MFKKVTAIILATVITTTLFPQTDAARADTGTPAAPLSLTVIVSGADANKGQVMARLFSSAESYTKEAYATQTAAVDSDGKATLVFEGLPAGDYAFSAFYDRDSDGKMKKNFLGIPREKFGFSNNAAPSMGPPSYEKARFTLGPNNTHQSITVYALGDHKK